MFKLYLVIKQNHMESFRVG
jgi:hypothetical protein